MIMPPGHAKLKSEIEALYNLHPHHHGPRLSIDVREIERLLRKLMKQIYDARQMPEQLDAEVINSTAKLLYDGVEKGYGQKLINLDYNTPDFNMLTSLKSDVWQFSAAKNYQQMKAMTEALLGPDGQLRSFSEFKQAVKPIIGDHTRWLQTEYRTAIASSQMAAKWQQIQSQKESFPLLRFDAVLDDRTTELCKSLDGVVRPIDDAFWNSYYPPNHFNCRSDVRQLREGEADITPTELIAYPVIPKMFLTNTAKQGLVFPPESNYYIGAPEHVMQNASLYMDKEEAFLKIYYSENSSGFIKAHISKLKKRNYKRSDFNDLYEISVALANEGKKVEILPEIPAQEKDLREKLLPGVYENKNPDLRVDGKYYEVKRPEKMKFDTLSMNIRKASKQAANIIIILDTEFDIPFLENLAITRKNFEKNLEEIWFYYEGKFIFKKIF